MIRPGPLSAMVSAKGHVATITESVDLRPLGGGWQVRDHQNGVSQRARGGQFGAAGVPARF